LALKKRNQTFATEATNRQQNNFVSIFQYMTGNTDWAVPNYHNIKTDGTKERHHLPTISVPYDFDYAGFVDAPYAVPVNWYTVV